MGMDPFIYSDMKGFKKSPVKFFRDDRAELGTKIGSGNHEHLNAFTHCLMEQLEVLDADIGHSGKNFFHEILASKEIVSRILCQNTYSFFSPFLIPLIPHVEEFLLRRRKFGKVFSAYCSFRSMQTR